jgi:UDP-N-acetylglucosamine 1-carboxyvinyltransferase
MRDSAIVIRGKKRLAGRVKISGAKNAALPELAATILSPQHFHFFNVPVVEDIKVMIKALQRIGAESEFSGSRLDLRLGILKSHLVPKEIVETSRASILILGPLLARNGYARVSFPGGCQIGDRKIDFHLEGLKRMGADIHSEGSHIVARARKIKGIDYRFPNKTVTGTENLLMAACLANGTTRLMNCAVEPEVGDLVNLLRKMGGDIQEDEGDCLIIKGQTSLKGIEHTIIPDRIELGTYIIAGCFLNNDLIIENAVPEYVGSLIHILKQIGIEVRQEGNTMRVSANGNISPIDVETSPYPGFPTDLQAQLTTLLTQARGFSRVKENIFNNRFQHIKELNKLGANIEVENNVAIIKGQTHLRGGVINATDLRASAALVLGGLIADGETEIKNAHQLFRGYERLPEKLLDLGADLKIVNRSLDENNIIGSING